MPSISCNSPQPGNQFPQLPCVGPIWIRQMTSGSTREFMALHAIAVHFGRPRTPTDEAWIETFFGHLKAEFPHLLKIT